MHSACIKYIHDSLDVNIGVQLSACVIGFSNPTHAQ